MPNMPSTSTPMQETAPQQSEGHSETTSSQQRRRKPSQRQEIPEPEPAHLPDDTADDEREAISLQSPDSRTNAAKSKSRVLPPNRHRDRWYQPVWKLWRYHVRLTVPHDDCRDHLGASASPLPQMFRACPGPVIQARRKLTLDLQRTSAPTSPTSAPLLLWRC